MKIFNWTNIRLILILGLVLFLFSINNLLTVSGFTKSVFSPTKTTTDFFSFRSPFRCWAKEYKNKRDASSIRKDELDLNKIEKNLDAQAMIEKSDVFVSIDGVLKAVVKQKTPIVRVYDGDRSFYIDYEGNKMPLSDNFTARVPLVSGAIFLYLYNVLSKTAFWKKAL